MPRVIGTPNTQGPQRTTRSMTKAAASTPATAPAAPQKSVLGKRKRTLGSADVNALIQQPDYEGIAGVAPVRQADDNSCWAACTVMAHHLFNPAVRLTENNVIRTVQPGAVINAPPASKKRRVSQTGIEPVLTRYGLDLEFESQPGTTVPQRPSIADVYDAIADSQPLIMCLTERDQIGDDVQDGHYVMVTGASVVGAAIEIVNPSDGKKSAHKWNDADGRITLITERHPGQTDTQTLYCSQAIYVTGNAPPSGTPAPAASSGP